MLKSYPPVPDNVPENLFTYYEDIIKNAEIELPLYSKKSDMMCGIQPLIFSTAIVVDLHESGYVSRFCYAIKTMAILELAKWYRKGFDKSQLPRHWIACRGLNEKQLTEGYPKNYGHELLITYEKLFGKPLKYRTDINSKEILLSEAMGCSFNCINHLVAYLHNTNILL